MVKRKGKQKTVRRWCVKRETSGLAPRAAAIILGVITLLGLVVRLPWLGDIPHGLSDFGAAFGLFAIQALEGAPFQAYGVEDEGTATLFGYLVAICFKLFGVGLVQLRLVPALLGMLTIPAFYLLARRFLSRDVALAATMMFGLSRWTVHFSRLAVEVVLVPLAEILLFYFLLVGLERCSQRGRSAAEWNDVRPFVLAGFCMALGLNSYTAFRLVPFVLVVAAGILAVFQRKQLSTCGRGVAWFGASSVAFSAPLLIYIAAHFGSFMQHTRTASVFQHLPREEWLGALWSGFWRSVGMFSFCGDPLASNNLPGAPILDPLMSVFFIGGVLLVLRDFKRPRSLFFIAWFLITLPASFLTNPSEVPSIRRTIGLAPLVFLVGGLALEWLKGLLARRHMARSFWPCLLVFCAVLSVGISLHSYFVRQAGDARCYRAFESARFAAAHRMLELKDENVVLASSKFRRSVMARVIRFLTYPDYLDIELFIPGKSLPARPRQGKGLAFLLSESYQAFLPELVALYPQGELTEQRDKHGGFEFYQYLVSPDAARGKGFFVATPADGTKTSFPELTATGSFEGMYMVGKPGHRTFCLAGEKKPRFSFGGKRMALHRQDGAWCIKVRWPAPGWYPISWQGAKDEGLEVETGLAGVLAEDALIGMTPARQGGLSVLCYTLLTNGKRKGPPVSFSWRYPFIPEAHRFSYFGMTWYGSLTVEREDRYGFQLASDDGSMLFIDKKKILDSWGMHSLEKRESWLTLSPGKHDIALHYTQYGGSFFLELAWQPPGATDWKPIPQELLLPGGYRSDAEDMLP